MLHDQLRHNLPGFAGCGIGVMGTVNLEHVCPCHDSLGLTGIDEGSYAVDVTVEYIVLGILMGSVDSFLSKHNCNLRAGHAGYIGMIIDGTANFILDDVEGLALGTYLFSGDRHAADTLRCSLHQSIDMGLAHVADYHDMVCAMPCSHAHAADIVLKTAGGNLRGDNRQGLGINVLKVFCRWKAYSVFKRFRNVMVGKGSHGKAGGRLAPYPASSSGLILI